MKNVLSNAPEPAGCASEEAPLTCGPTAAIIPPLFDMQHIRNIAIIAHVDHGKTTLVDQLLRQSGTFRANQQVAERVMDSMDLEREKGITIRAKNAAFKWHDYHVNIVDTPGHADFGGEVERIMKMVDGVLLVVDAHDGPQAQTKFVLRKALENGAKPIVVINKIDRENARPHKVLDMVFDLFVELNATDVQLDFPVDLRLGQGGLRDAAKSTRRSQHDGAAVRGDRETHPAAAANADVPISRCWFPTSITAITSAGSPTAGSPAARIKVGDTVVRIAKDGSRERANITAIFSHQGLAKIEIKHASAGDIVGIAGFEDAFIGETITDSEERLPLPFVDIDPPTIKMQFCINDSPLAGREGKLLTARQIRDRLVRETRDERRHPVRRYRYGGPFRNQRARRNADRDPRRADAARGIRAAGLAARGHLTTGTKRATCSSRSRRSTWTCRRKTSATSCNRWPAARRRS